MTTLKLGSLSIDVIKLQLRLDLNAIPYFDECTHKAVIAFQKANKPTPDGVVGLKTRVLQIIIPLILAGALLLGCTEKSLAEKPIEEGSIELPSYDCGKSVKSMDLFWKKFRAAMLKDDMTALAAMTEFPLRILGPSDVHRTSISRREFAKYFPYLLNAPMKTLYRVTEPEHASMKELARNLPTLSEKQCGDIEGQMDIEQWTFIMRAEGWRLVAVGVYEFNPPRD